ncbi:hypothetical protein K1719_005663 [Acacia pycnantha]|nr:hypothetical protein K1719_005663 [Acacia pycnantha]
MSERYGFDECTAFGTSVADLHGGGDPIEEYENCYIPIPLDLAAFLVAPISPTPRTLSGLRAIVCAAFFQLIEVCPSFLEPHLRNVIEYMLQVNKDRDDEVSLEACEFWSAYCDAQLPPENLREFLPRLIPMMMNQSLKLRKMVPYLIEIRLEEVVLRHLGAADGTTMIAKDVRFSMSGLMHQLDISQSLHVTHLIGRNGGRTQRKWSCISLWAKTMCHSTLR